MKKRVPGKSTPRVKWKSVELDYYSRYIKEWNSMSDLERAECIYCPEPEDMTAAVHNFDCAMADVIEGLFRMDDGDAGAVLVAYMDVARRLDPKYGVVVERIKQLAHLLQKCEFPARDRKYFDVNAGYLFEALNAILPKVCRKPIGAIVDTWSSQLWPALSKCTNENFKAYDIRINSAIARIERALSRCAALMREYIIDSKGARRRLEETSKRASEVKTRFRRKKKKHTGRVGRPRDENEIKITEAFFKSVYYKPDSDKGLRGQVLHFYRDVKLWNDKALIMDGKRIGFRRQSTINNEKNDKAAIGRLYAQIVRILKKRNN